MLFSSRELEKVELADCYNPVLLGLTWFWLVDLTFLSWANRVVTRAAESGALSATAKASWLALKEYGRATYGSECDTIPARSALPVALTPIPVEFFDPAFRGLIGMSGDWVGQDSDVLKWGARR